MSAVPKFLKLFFAVLAAAVVLYIHLPQEAGAAGITVYKKDGRYVKLGGRIQLQYHYKDPDSGDASDRVFFRRFRPYIEGSLYKDWKGKFQWDMGKAKNGNEVAVKDAYMQYAGLRNIKIAVGNKGFPFSREFLTSSKKQQLVERTFVGDHNYGTPDRNVGIHLTGHSNDKRLTYGFSVASASIDPDAGKLDFDSPVNRDADFNEGWIIGGRVDYHPFGNLKFSQGDFKRKTRATIGIAAFTWNNDDDNNTYIDSPDTDGKKFDVDKVTGLELSGAFRASGFSVDAEYNLFKADTVAANLTNGIYRNGSTDLKNYAIKGGYMVVPDTIELVAAYQAQDADNYEDTWSRTSVGANWFIRKHDIKVQLTYRIGKNLKGVSGNDEDELFIQTQYVF